MLTLLATLGLASKAEGAKLTDVADAFDTIAVGDTEVSDAFDLYVTSDFSFEWSWGKITREPINVPTDRPIPNCNNPTDPTTGTDRQCLSVSELGWQRNVQKMELRLEVGVFHDLAITAMLPVYLADSLAYDYADGLDATKSSVDRGGTSTDNYLPAPAALRYSRGYST